MASSSARDVKLRGVGASPGVAVGSVLRLDERGRHQFYYLDVSAAQVRREARRLHEAFEQARAELQEIKARLTRELGYEHSFILDAHLLMLEDERLLAEIENEIRTRRVNAEWAVRSVIDRVEEAYRQVNDAYLRERTSDLEDVATRLLTILSGRDKFDLSELDENVILVAKDIWPSTVAELDFNRVLGFATNSGGITSRANVELPTEIDTLARFGAEGIGLYRSEFIFLAGLPNLPGEDEQYQLYRRLAEAAGDAGASIRVFDLGGDKLTLQGYEEEMNPALGLRGIRLSLREIGRAHV